MDMERSDVLALESRNDFGSHASACAPTAQVRMMVLRSGPADIKTGITVGKIRDLRLHEYSGFICTRQAGYLEALASDGVHFALLG